MYVETILLEGHIIDSHLLSKILDTIVQRGAHFELLDLSVGHRQQDISTAKLFIRADKKTTLEKLLKFIKENGGKIPEPADVNIAPSPANGVFPEGFYSTTNLETWIRLKGKEIKVKGEGMDMGIAVSSEKRSAQVVPMDEVKKGQYFVVGTEGIKIMPLKVPSGRKKDLFGFMLSEVSVEKPRYQVVEEIAGELKSAHERGKKNLLVLGPAVIHSGAVDILSRLIRMGIIDLIFGGNAVAAHDIEYALYGTSLGIDIKEGTPVRGGHQHHLRAINTIRAAGGIKEAIESGILRKGIMHSAYTSNVNVVLAGSIRDDGPLPEVITDILKAKKIMRSKLKNVEVAVMVATALHSIATGNLLPARVRTYCVDINPGAVTKLMDRGSLQTTPVVMDCESFFYELSELL